MLEYGALPPEINSGLMYTGPGAGPMLVTSWAALADNLYWTATSYGAAISDLTTSWLGPSSASMAAAAAPYVSWISATAAQAEQAATQAKAAVAAYEAAFAMTVPPPVIAANRALLLMLVATNFLGQNTPAIMATEAEYAEMWAQDAGAMSGARSVGELREHHVRRVQQRLHRCDAREPFGEVLGIRVVVCEPLDVVSSAHRHAAARIPDCRICFAPAIARVTSALSLSAGS